jgi:catechol 2,3-dioxygenase-like lactoylglutathione lyase family enzyme
VKRVALVLVVAGLFVGGPVAVRRGNADAPPAGGGFASTTIDLGMVVRDVDRSAAFYKEALGLREVKGFSVPGDFCADAGLTDGKPLTIRVFVLGDGEQATKLKLMAVAGVETKAADNQYIHSQTGYRYLTLAVKDMTAALARLQKAGVKPMAKTPVSLPRGFPEGVYLTCVRDPDGNIVELVGPKK